MPQSYNPPGFEFYDANHGKMKLVHDPGQELDGWILRWHEPNGCWVTFRPATEEDLAKVTAAKLVSWAGFVASLAEEANRS